MYISRPTSLDQRATTRVLLPSQRKERLQKKKRQILQQYTYIDRVACSFFCRGFEKKMKKNPGRLGLDRRRLAHTLSHIVTHWAGIGWGELRIPRKSELLCARVCGRAWHARARAHTHTQTHQPPAAWMRDWKEECSDLVHAPTFCFSPGAV